MVKIWCLGQRGQGLVLEIFLDMSHQLICKLHEIPKEEVGPGKLSVHAQWKEVFRLLVLSRKGGTEDRKHSAFRLEEDGALRAHNLMKQKGLQVMLKGLNYICLRGAQLLT
jgi:hypothetical protein